MPVGEILFILENVHVTFYIIILFEMTNMCNYDCQYVENVLTLIKLVKHDEIGYLLYRTTGYSKKL